MVNQEYIRNKQSQSNHFNLDGIEIWIKDPVTNGVSVRSVVQKLVEIVPSELLSNIDAIYIGNFEELNRRKIQAMYKDSSIFSTNKQSSEEDLLDDLVHEVAHSVEETHGQQIYLDQKLEKEFLSKRKEMWLILKDEGFELELQHFLSPEYHEEFDMFLYKEVGYPLLSSITANLFYSPYGATSLREYFANGFEAFFLKEEVSRLKAISPILYKKISDLI